MSAPDANFVPAPWQLRGEGFLFLYRFDQGWLAEHEAIPPALTERFAGGLGALMLVDYQSGTADPYRELLFMPGKFRWGQVKKHCITEIVVSTEQSVVSGRANWAIPKRQADFDWSADGSRGTRIEVREQGQETFRAAISHVPIPRPMHTALLAMPLAQPDGDELVLTPYSGRGVAWPARLESISTEGGRFPPLEQLRPLTGFRVAPFTLRFPVAERPTLDETCPPLWEL